MRVRIQNEAIVTKREQVSTRAAYERPCYSAQIRQSYEFKS